MKTTTLIIIGLFTSVLSHAQTFTGQYVSQTTAHHKDGVHTSNTTKFKPGTISITKEAIQVDTAQYVILKHGAIANEDEGLTSESLIVANMTKKGTYKVSDCVIVFKKNKSTIISYLIN